MKSTAIFATFFLLANYIVPNSAASNCSSQLKPVCVNNQTYPSLCVYNWGQINSPADFEDGPCPGFDRDKCKYAPQFAVCGKEGVTYSSECFALLYGAEVAYRGPCGNRVPPRPITRCPCSFLYKPVCVHTNTLPYTKTWPSECLFNCQKIPSDDEAIVTVTAGACPGKDPLQCPPGPLAPVCGNDGRTYGNDCIADRLEITVKSQGECQEPKDPSIGCACSSALLPVCGIDGESYLNECYANCAGTTATDGHCDGQYGH